MKTTKTVGDLAEEALRNMQVTSRLINHPNISIHRGEPCIKGTKITVAYILRRLCALGSTAKVVAFENKRKVTLSTVGDCLRFAADDVATRQGDARG